MPCSEYQRLEAEQKLAQDNVHFYHPVNSSIHFLSKPKAIQLKREAQAQAFALADKMTLHKSYCKDCKDEANGTAI